MQAKVKFGRFVLGLKKSYTPEELKDRLILLFANLKQLLFAGL